MKRFGFIPWLAAVVCGLLMGGRVAFGAVPFASEVVTVSTTPIGITANLCRVGGASTSAIVEVVTGTINYLLHDAAATPGATSHLLTVGSVLEMVEPYKFVAVRNGGSDATVRVTCVDRLQETRVFKLPVAGGAASNVTVTDGVDTAQVTSTAGGALQVECVGGTCGSAAPFADNSAFTGSSTPVVPMGALYDTTPPAITDGNAGVPRMNSSRVLMTDGSGVTQPVSGTVTANAGSGTFFDGIVRDGAGDTTQANVSSGRLHVDGSGVTQPVSGTVTANAGTGPWPVTDNGGSLTVDAPVGTPVNVQIGDGTRTATVRDTGTSDSLNVAIVDASGAQITSFGGGTEYNQGTATTDTDTMTMAGAVRRDTAAVATGVVDGDRITLSTDSVGRLRTTAADTTQPVSGTVTANAGTGTFFDGIIRDGAGDTTQANVSSGRVHVDGSGVTQPVSGSISITQGGNTAAVNGSSQLSVNCANCSGSGVSHQDKTGFTAGTTNFVPVGGYRDDTAPSTVTEGEAAAARLTENRAIHVNLRDATGAEVSVGGGTQYDQGTATTDTDKLTMGGAVRRDTAAVATGVVDGDRLALSTDSVGRLRTTAADTTQPVSGTVTANAGSGTFFDGIVRDGTGDTTQANVSSGRLHVDGSGVTQPVSGTVTANQGGSNWSTNVAQFGGTNVVTGTGAGGSGIPRVTISNDSSLAANQSVNNAQVNGSTIQVASNGLNTTGAGLQALAMVGQCDDTSPTALTENQFGHARINCTTHHQLVEVGAALPTGSNTIGNVNPGTAANWGVYVEDAAETAGGNLSMSGAVRRDTLASSSGTSGDNSTINTTADGALWVAPVAATNGGTSISRIVSAASTNATNVKASAGQVYTIIASNVNAAARYVHFYNTSGTPTCNTSIISTFIIPGNTAGAGTNITIPPGAAFATGIGVCITTGVDGTGNVAANEIVLNTFYR